MFNTGNQMKSSQLLGTICWEVCCGEEGDQEINITSAIKIFSEKFQVLVNIEEGSKDGIGIVSLIKKDIHIVDTIVGVNGRIIGIQIKDAQFWNIYPQSGTNLKNSLFFGKS